MRKVTNKENYQIKVGDHIVSRHSFGGSNWKVHRVTKLYAFVWYNDVAEGKFPRKYGWCFMPLPRAKWNTTSYEVYES